MIYRIFLLVLSSLMATTLSAHIPVGEWSVYNNYTHRTGKVIDTADKVFFLSEGNLFHYDKKSDETFGYTMFNGLSGVDIADIYRNNAGRYLLVVYGDGNIDLLHDNGDIINLGDIKDAPQVTGKNINDVAFEGNLVHVAAGFGIVTFNTRDYTVVESGIFNREVTAIAVVGENMVICCDDKLYTSPLKERHNTFDAFTPLGELASMSMAGISENRALSVDGRDNGKAYVIEFDFEKGSFKARDITMGRSRHIIDSGDFHTVSSRYELAIFDSEGRQLERIDIPSEFRLLDDEPCVSTCKGMESVWLINRDGLCNVNMGNKGESLTFNHAFLRPMGTSLVSGAGYLAKGASGNVYASNRAVGRNGFMAGYDAVMGINVINQGFVENITPELKDVTLNNRVSHGLLRAGTRILEDPEEPGTLFVGTWYEGIYKFRDGKQIGKYDWNNSPFKRDYSCCVLELAFDSYNNLWCYGINASDFVIAVLPASKRKFDNTTVDDWVVIDIEDFGTYDTWNAVILPCKSRESRNVTLIAEGWNEFKFAVYDTGGTMESISDDRYRVIDEFVDQDGKVYSSLAVTCMVEDSDGSVWLGSDEGVFIIRRPVDMLNSGTTVEHVKVSRNDGSGYADYLLDGIKISSISIDASGRKWISTTSDGIYLVARDGREIVEHFTTGNSDIPTDEINVVLCSDIDNTVYAGTRYGVSCYGADFAPVADDFFNVTVYPNPVRPDYSGPVTIEGLSERSLVKIGDASVNIFFQGRPEGGMLTWNCCDRSGKRVTSGVYYVFASSSDGSEGVVTKIMVIN